MTTKTHHDVIIVGAGAAGLSAALVLARAQAKVLLIDSGEPRNAPAGHMHGFLSRDGISPAHFLALANAEVTGYGALIESATVTAVDRREDGQFAVTLGCGEVHTTRALLLATGLRDELPDIPGLRERWGSLVHHCPYCHGYEVRDHAIAVIGGPNREMSLKQAGLLRRYSDRVQFITNGIELTLSERQRLEAFGVHVVEAEVAGLTGTAVAPEAVRLSDGWLLECEAVFVAPQPRANDALLLSRGCDVVQATGLIAVDASGQTSVPGVWAAGNVVTPSAQVISAAGAGSTSAMAINGWLLEHDMQLPRPKGTSE